MSKQDNYINFYSLQKYLIKSVKCRFSYFSAGLSSGAKAAVAICILLMIAALVGGCIWFYFFMKQRNFEFNKLWNDFQVRSKLAKTNATTPSGFDNVAYVNNSEDSRIHNDILDSA